jgi:hypothetical protein
VRPPGLFGEVGQALCSAARESPGTVYELAQRAQVAYGTARYTATRLVGRGALVVVEKGRPSRLGAPPSDVASLPPSDPTLLVDESLDQLEAAMRSFWESP